MRLIDADALLDKCKEYGTFMVEYTPTQHRETIARNAATQVVAEMKYEVEHAPEAIVRCKDCFSRDKYGYCVAPMGEVGYVRVDDDDFCSCGVRKKVEHDT